ncbi:hypothetical protein Salat_2183800 [Sesamum alatum]|uniref:Uncharacterized protein n=1 Tax=Sesamum alatum TaxID=300844 RepID=A0AAE2CD44_9LAMI|nr:hypothetical protein Salat_2183800 [Sesamum alatum]
MEALKRAYAEMILNTAKEAAARVMAAEVRARRLEEDLASTKGEGAPMLLRLKQMIDVKTKEAENSLLSQQTRLYELESQLNEAEGIILGLRAELNQAQERLDEAKRNKLPSRSQNENEEMRNMTPKDTYSGYELLASSMYSAPESITDRGKISCTDTTTLEQKCCIPDKQSVNFNMDCDIYSGDDHPFLDQVKVPELLRNGCTQRICATETNLLQERFPVGDKSNPSNSSTNVHASALEGKIQHGENEPISVVRRSRGKRKLEFWDDVITACALRSSYQIKKPSQAYNPSKVKLCVKSGEDQFQAEGQTRIDESLDLPESPKEEVISTEALPENMELIDVLEKQDELAATFELTSSSRVDCDVEGGTTKASNLSHENGKKPYKYTFSRKWKKKSMIYPKKSSSLGEKLLQIENGDSGFQNSSLSIESYGDSRQLVQVAHQVSNNFENGLL